MRTSQKMKEKSSIRKRRNVFLVMEQKPRDIVCMILRVQELVYSRDVKLKESEFGIGKELPENDNG